MSLLNKSHVRARALEIANPQGQHDESGKLRPYAVTAVSKDVFELCEAAVVRVLCQAAAQNRRGARTLTAPRAAMMPDKVRK